MQSIGSMRAVAYCLLALPGMVLHQGMQDILGVSLATFIPFYLAILFVVIFIHEFGHAVAVQLVGWRLHAIAVVPLIYRFEKRRWGFWTAASGDLGGMVSYSPIGPAFLNKGAWIAAAGPLANFAFALTAFIATASPIGNTAQSVAGALAVTSLFTGLGNILPWRSKGGSSDGKILLSRLRALRRDTP
jgi:Zn-dependent protease